MYYYVSNRVWQQSYLKSIRRLIKSPFAEIRWQHHVILSTSSGLTTLALTSMLRSTCAQHAERAMTITMSHICLVRDQESFRNVQRLTGGSGTGALVICGESFDVEIPM